jgi:uncharacterized protein
MLDHQYLYFPEPWDDSQDWKTLSGLPLEEVWLNASDGTRLFGWFLQAPGAREVMLWCHGNAGNIAHRLENLTQVYQRGISVFLFDYRGYGRSQGAPSEEGLYQDVVAAWDYLREERKIPAARIVVFGRSLGGAVAGELALKKEVAGLILESTFPSVEAVARRMFSGFPAHLMLKARFDLAERLKRIRVPVLVLHGDRDSLIPFEMGQAVFQAANPPKTFYPVEGADHNDTAWVGAEAYFRALFDFIRKVTGGSLSDV